MNGITITITDTNPEEWSFWNKLGIYLRSPFNVCKCGRGKHIEWPQSPAEIIRDIQKDIAERMAADKDKEIIKKIKRMGP